MRRQQLPQPCFDGSDTARVRGRRTDEPVAVPSSHDVSGRGLLSPCPDNGDQQRLQIGGRQPALECPPGTGWQGTPDPLGSSIFAVWHLATIAEICCPQTICGAPKSGSLTGSAKAGLGSAKPVSSS
jgi:hypothetical protein